jgi:hypothetical protein
MASSDYRRRLAHEKQQLEALSTIDAVPCSIQTSIVWNSTLE